MKKFLAILLFALLLLVGCYLWLMSEGHTDNADQTLVTTPLDVQVER